MLDFIWSFLRNCAIAGFLLGTVTACVYLFFVVGPKNEWGFFWAVILGVGLLVTLLSE